jgi:hypothetical protein
MLWVLFAVATASVAARTPETGSETFGKARAAAPAVFVAAPTGSSTSPTFDSVPATRATAPASPAAAPVLPSPRRERDHLLHWTAWRRRHQPRAAEAHRHWNNVTAAATT